MMEKVRFIFYAVVAALCISGCDKPEPENPDDKGDIIICPTDDFLLQVSDITSTSCHFSVEPSDEQLSYVVMIVAKEDFDAYENKYEYQDSDLEWFRLKAEENGQQLEDWLKDFLKKGPFEGDEEGLMPGQSYYLYAYGLDYEGYFTTGVTFLEFSTPEIEMSDVTFDVSVSDVGMTQVKVEVTASKEDARFFVNVFSLDQYQEWGGDETAFSNHAGALVDYYVKMGKTLEEIVANLGSIGHCELVIDELMADTEYIAYAIGIDENFFVNTAAETLPFKTAKAAKSDNTFEVNIEGTTFCSVIGTVTPSNGDPFICAIQPKAQLEQYTSDEAIMYELVGTFQKWDMLEDVLYKDEVVELEPISSLTADTDYVLLCFGWDSAPTTDLTKVEFRTAEAGGDARAQEITFVLSDILHNKVTVNISPKLGLHYFYDCISKETLDQYEESEGSTDLAVCRFLDERIDYGAEYFGSSRAEYLEDMGAAIGKQKWTFTGLEEDTEYMIVAATVDVATGRIAQKRAFCSELFRTGILVESDASIEFVIDKYYDGSELADIDPAQFGKCKGLVMVPYTIVPNETAAHWRTTFAYGEFASWAQRDDIIYELDYKCDNDKIQGYAVVHYDQIVSFIGIAEDAQGYTGPFALYEFKAVKGGASPAQEFIDSLNS